MIAKLINGVKIFFSGIILIIFIPIFLLLFILALFNVRFANDILLDIVGWCDEDSKIN